MDDFMLPSLHQAVRRLGGLSLLFTQINSPTPVPRAQGLLDPASSRTKKQLATSLRPRSCTTTQLAGRRRTSMGLPERASAAGSGSVASQGPSACTCSVPAGVPSVRHSSTPCTPSSALK